MAKGLIKLTASHQLAERIHGRIRQGVWSHGAPLPSMRELAEEYRVSLTTVQKAMQELQDREAIRLRPRQGAVVAEQVSFDQSRRQIAMLLGLDPQSTLSSWWRDRITYFAQSVLTQNGYQVNMFHYWQHEPDHAGQLIKSVSTSLDGLAGVFFFGLDDVRGVGDYFDSVDIPWITVNPIDLRTPHNFVMADHLVGGRTVGECFIRLGYERVVVLYDELKNVSPLEKVTGICQSFLHHHRQPGAVELVQCANMDLSAGYDAMREYLRNQPAPHGIFATADTLAVGAMRACQERGLRVPQDVGVVGSTGLPASELRSDPQLTELRQPVEEIGRQLGGCLLEMIRGSIRRISGRRVPSPVVLNESLPVTEEMQREIGLDLFADSEGNLLQPDKSTNELYRPGEVAQAAFPATSLR